MIVIVQVQGRDGSSDGRDEERPFTIPGNSKRNQTTSLPRSGNCGKSLYCLQVKLMLRDSDGRMMREEQLLEVLPTLLSLLQVWQTFHIIPFSSKSAENMDFL